MKLLLAICASITVFAGNPISIELRDQFEVPQKLSFPTERLTILTIADRKGNDQVDDWIAALKPRYAGRVEFKGIAQVSAVPSFLQSHVRRKFQESRKYPVMMDWTGEVCSQLSVKPGVANVLIFDRAGEIVGRFEGKATERTVAAAAALIQGSLTHE